MQKISGPLKSDAFKKNNDYGNLKYVNIIALSIPVGM